MKPGLRVAEDAAFRFDTPIIDGAVNGAGRLVRAVATRGRGMQTGMVRSYGALFAAGTIGCDRLDHLAGCLRC